MKREENITRIAIDENQPIEDVLKKMESGEVSHPYQSRSACGRGPAFKGEEARLEKENQKNTTSPWY